MPGRDYLARRLGVAPELVRSLRHFGLSSIANILGAIKMAKHAALGPDDVIVTVATDGHEMYRERAAALPEAPAQPGRADERGGRRDRRPAPASAPAPSTCSTPPQRERERIFNLGYFTWVEQQGIALADFDRRRSQAFWRGLHDLVPQWDEMITAFNRDSGMAAAA